jgi:hypothetical protein
VVHRWSYSVLTLLVVLTYCLPPWSYSLLHTYFQRLPLHLFGLATCFALSSGLRCVVVWYGSAAEVLWHGTAATCHLQQGDALLLASCLHSSFPSLPPSTMYCSGGQKERWGLLVLFTSPEMPDYSLRSSAEMVHYSTLLDITRHYSLHTTSCARDVRLLALS